MTKPMLRIVLAAEILSVAVFAFWVLDVNPASAEVTAYAIYCGRDLGDHGPCINLPPITYQVSTDRQEVEYWPDTGAPTTLTDCIVHDPKNWECWYKDRVGRLSMADGQFHDMIWDAVLDRDVFDSVRYVPKWKWLAVNFGIHVK